MTKEEIKQTYLKNEKILWTKTPDALKLFTRADFVLVPLSVILGGGMLIYAISSLLLMLQGKSVSFSLVGITLILISIYLIFGRLWYRKKRVERNIYFITEKRVFVFNTLRDTVILDMLLTDVTMRQQKNTLYLGDSYLFGNIIYGLGLDVFLHNVASESPAFYAISDTDTPAGIITDAKKQGKAAFYDRTDSDFI